MFKKRRKKLQKKEESHLIDNELIHLSNPHRHNQQKKVLDVASGTFILECFSSLSYVVIFLKIVLTSAKLIKN